MNVFFFVLSFLFSVDGFAVPIPSPARQCGLFLEVCAGEGFFLTKPGPRFSNEVATFLAIHSPLYSGEMPVPGYSWEDIALYIDKRESGPAESILSRPTPNRFFPLGYLQGYGKAHIVERYRKLHQWLQAIGDKNLEGSYGFIEMSRSNFNKIAAAYCKKLFGEFQVGSIEHFLVSSKASKRRFLITLARQLSSRFANWVERKFFSVKFPWLLEPAAAFSDHIHNHKGSGERFYLGTHYDKNQIDLFLDKKSARIVVWPSPRDS